VTVSQAIHIVLYAALGFAGARILSLRAQLRAMALLCQKQEQAIQALHAMIEWAPPLPTYLQRSKKAPSKEPN